MSPLVCELKKHTDIFDTKVCVTAQHREMLDQVLEVFKITPDFDLNIMVKNQDLYSISSKILTALKGVLNEYKPDLVFVHGDTTTTFMAALASFYQKINVAHIEAGLRTNNIYSPWPEEANRKLTSQISKYHFTPTQISKQNLLNENINESNILVTGNTVIDSLRIVLDNIKNSDKLRKLIHNQFEKFNIDLKEKIILVTGHRRENFGEGFLNICEALKEIARKNPKYHIVYPVHLNPNVKNIVYKTLKNIPNIHLINPIDYEPFIYLMYNSFIILTDSGGIQEEAPSLGKPVLVMRDTTERPEAVTAGTVKLVGTNKEKIANEVQKLIDTPSEYKRMSKAHNPYGTGNVCKKIVNYLIGNNNEKKSMCSRSRLHRVTNSISVGQ